MRVQDKSINKKYHTESGKLDRAAKVSSIQRSFQDVFQEQNPVSWQEDLESLLNKLNEVGQRLVKTFSIYDLIEYKDTLKSFLNDSLKKAFGLKEEMSYSRRGRPKIYQYIEVIDQELEDLSKLVLAQQKDPVKVLKKLDSIRGLLVDLYY
jgi:uncharacterized protein YaaR (DUF327 family)